MKFSNLVSLVALAGLTSMSSAHAAVLQQDPVSKQKYFIWDEDAGKAGVVVGWTFQAPTSDKIDYDKIAQKDEAYINSIVDSLDDTVNLLVDNKTKHVVAELYAEKASFRACYSTAVYSSNHCSIDLNYEANSRLAVVVLDAKWGTAQVSAYRLKPGTNGMEVQASTTGMIEILENDLKIQLDQKNKSKSDYQRDRDSLANSYTVAGFELRSDNAQGYVIDVTFSAGGEVPKQDGFTYEKEKMTYRVRGTQSYTGLTFEKQ